VKDYPSIPHLAASGLLGSSFHTFAKVDGSNLRAQWNPKRGFYKFGTRTQLLSPEDSVFGPALPLFQDTLASALDAIARAQRWTDLVVFLEFAGPRSFAGSHLPDDPKSLYLLDAAANQQGILGPARFLELFGALPHPDYLGYRVWDRAFVSDVARGSLPGMSFEGVVGKAGERHQLRFVKTKSQAWIDAVRARYSPEQAKLLI
jgi:hypothetical protein